MATADVLKPDHATSAEHFIFTDEHEQLRESIRRFVVGAAAPRRGVGGDDLPGLGLPRGWASSASSASTSPRSTAARAATTTRAWCSPRRSAHAHSGGLAMGVAVQTDMAMPPILAFGTEEQKQRVGGAGDRRARRSSASGSPSPTPAPTSPGSRPAPCTSRRRRVRHQRLQDLHHQRPPRRRDRARDQDRPPTPATTASRCSWCRWTAGRDPREAPGEARHARLRHGAARLPGRARRRESAVLGEVGKGFYHIMWELQGERLIGAAGCGRRRPARVRPDARVRQGAQGVRPRRSATSRPSATSSPRWRPRSRPRGSSSTRPPGASRTASTRCARSRWPSCTRPRIAVEVADECIQIHGGAGYMQEYGIERVLARPAPEPDRRRHRRDHARRDRPLLRAVAAAGPLASVASNVWIPPAASC